MLPLICRRGHVTKSDIGAIRVFDRETRFEIVSSAASRFAAAVQEGPDDVRITSLDEPDLPPARDRKRPPPRADNAGPSRKPAARPKTAKRQLGRLKGGPRT